MADDDPFQTLLPGYTDRLFQIESGGNPHAQTGSYRGLGQFGPKEEKQFGITDWTDPSQQRAAVAQSARQNYQGLSAALGRPPTPGELYLAHQQGAAGAPALLKADPATPAWQAIRPYYGSDAMAQKAIAGNIPSNSPLHGLPADQVTAGDFSNLWVNKFEGGAAPTYNFAQSPSGTSSTPAAPSSLGMLGDNSSNLIKLAQQLGGGKGLLNASQNEPPPELPPLPTSTPAAMALKQQILASIFKGQSQ